MQPWIEHYSKWPSFPQLYIDKKFIGGVEIVIRLIEDDVFMNMVPSECIRTNAIERIGKALSKSIVVMFIKGTRRRPFDGYQR